MTLDLWTFDVGVAADTPEAYAEECIRRVEDSWAGGADIVLFPEFCWAGLERFLPRAAGLRGLSDLYWKEMWPDVRRRLDRDDKAVVLGTAPFWDTGTNQCFNRAPILSAGRELHQDKRHLTPWETGFAGVKEVRLWDFCGLTVAVLICFDVEVPELSAALRGHDVDLLLVPSATETLLGVERVNRCASARAVELGCCVGVAHLVGRGDSELIDVNVGRTAFYTPSQGAFAGTARVVEGAVEAAGFHRLRCHIDAAALDAARRNREETNPARLPVGRRFWVEKQSLPPS